MEYSGLSDWSSIDSICDLQKTKKEKICLEYIQPINVFWYVTNAVNKVLLYLNQNFRYSIQPNMYLRFLFWMQFCSKLFLNNHW